MLYYDRTNVSEGIDVNETWESKEFDIFQYWYFLNKGSKFQEDVRNRCHDIFTMSVNFCDIISVNPKTAGGVNPFSPWFFVTFNIIIRHIFLKISLKFLKSFRSYEQYLGLY